MLISKMGHNDGIQNGSLGILYAAYKDDRLLIRVLRWKLPRKFRSGLKITNRILKKN